MCPEPLRIAPREAGPLLSHVRCARRHPASVRVFLRIRKSIMQQNTEEEIPHILRERGELFAPEAEIISAVFACLRSDRDRVLRKAIILSLIAELESTSDGVRSRGCEILRS